jgi:transposase
MRKTVDLGAVTAEEVAVALKCADSPESRRRLTAMQLLQRRQDSADAVARTVGASRSVVFIWARKCKTSGLAGLLRHRRVRGRKPGMPQKVRDELKSGLRRGEWSEDQAIVDWLMRCKKVKIEISVVRYWRRKWRFVRKRGRPRLLAHTPSPAPKRDLLLVNLDDDALRRIRATLSRDALRETPLQAILLLAARTLLLFGDKDKERYERMVFLAVSYKNSPALKRSTAEIIKEAEESKCSVNWIVKTLGCSRMSLYRWVQRLETKPLAQFLRRQSRVSKSDG